MLTIENFIKNDFFHEYNNYIYNIKNASSDKIIKLNIVDFKKLAKKKNFN